MLSVKDLTNLYTYIDSISGNLKVTVRTGTTVSSRYQTTEECITVVGTPRRTEKCQYHFYTCRLLK